MNARPTFPFEVTPPRCVRIAIPASPAFITEPGGGAVLKMPLGNLGLWLSLHLWFLARRGFSWAALERGRGALFA